MVGFGWPSPWRGIRSVPAGRRHWWACGQQIELRINLSAYFPDWLWFVRSERGSGGLASGGEGNCVGVSFQVPIGLLPGRVRAKR